MNRGSTTDPARICVTNAKGGTGKTAVAINVAGAPWDRGRDILLVDRNPQGNAAEKSGLGDTYDARPPSLFDALTGDPELLDGIVIEHEEMDVVPSNIVTLQAEHELPIADLIARINARGLDINPSVLTRFGINISPAMVSGTHALGTPDRALDTVSGYDYVIIDPPPFYGNLTDTGVFAAQHVLVPALAEATSERAIEPSMEQMVATEQRADVRVEMPGVAANRIETTSEAETILNRFEAAFPDSPVWQVPKCVALQRVYTEGSPVFGSEKQCDMADVFSDTAAQFDEKFGYNKVTV